MQALLRFSKEADDGLTQRKTDMISITLAVFDE